MDRLLPLDLLVDPTGPFTVGIRPFTIPHAAPGLFRPLAPFALIVPTLTAGGLGLIPFACFTQIDIVFFLSLRHGQYPVVASLVADRKSTRLNSSHLGISYAVFCLKKKT